LIECLPSHADIFAEVTKRSTAAPRVAAPEGGRERI
jgi:hypothetical protein